MYNHFPSCSVADRMGHTHVHIDDVSPAGPGGAVRFVRRELGAGAFGINWFELPAGVTGHEHDEAGTGHEEVAVVIRGDGHWIVDGERVEVRTGSFLRIDPEAVRVPVAGSDGMTFLVVGAPREGGYQPRGPF